MFVRSVGTGGSAQVHELCDVVEAWIDSPHEIHRHHCECMDIFFGEHALVQQHAAKPHSLHSHPFVDHEQNLGIIGHVSELVVCVEVSVFEPKPS